MELGQILEIDQKVAEGIGKVNEAIDKMATGATAAAEKFRVAFTSMSQDVSNLEASLLKTGQALSSLGVDLTKPLNESLKSTSTAAANATTTISQVVDTMSKYANATASLGKGVESDNPFAKYNVKELEAQLAALQQQMERVKEHIRSLSQAADTGGAGLQKMATDAIPAAEKNFTQLAAKIANLQQLIANVKGQPFNETDWANYYNKLGEWYEKEIALIRKKQEAERKAYEEKMARNQQEHAATRASIDKYQTNQAGYERQSREYVRWWEDAIKKKEAAERASLKKLEQEALRLQKRRLDMQSKGYNNPNTASLKEQEAYQRVSQALVAIEAQMQRLIASSGNLAHSTDYLVSKEQLILDLKRRQDAENERNAAKEQARYAQLEKEYTRLEQMKNNAAKKGYDTGTAQEKAYYDEIVERQRRVREEMDKIEARNHSIRQSATERLRVTEQEIEAERRLAREKQKTVSNAVVMAHNARTYEQRAAAMKNLEAVIKSLDTTDANYQRNLRRLTSEYRNLAVQQKNVERQMQSMKSKQDALKNSASQLKNALVAAFSIGAIKNYVSKLIEVRGEFELQNVALRAILQNKDEADKLFQQVTELAVKSPFTVRQLTKYTKQLAAYQVESDKLYDTTKRLADVSAGLGVDMQRIILAFGQVKAANYLRATEVRQFTEAGINMLGELAKYYTEIEQRQISVADVQEMVTRRMVEFGDVEEVFNRLTSAGGIFYDMQEKQAQTLTGMMSNLKDSMDIMLNQIGIETEGFLKGTITTLRSFLQNWREVVYYLKIVVAAVGSFIAVSKLARLGMLVFGDSVSILASKILQVNGLTQAEIVSLKVNEAATLGLSKAKLVLAKSISTVEAAAKGMRVALLGAMGAVAIIGIIELVRHLTKASREAKQLRKEINRILTEDTSNLERSQRHYEELVDQLQRVNNGSKAHADIISELNSKYGEYIGFIVDENTTYEQLKDTLSEVNNMLARKAKLESTEKVLAKVYESTNKVMADEREWIEKHFKYLTRSILNKDEVNAFFNLLEKRIRETGNIPVNLTELLEEAIGRDITTNTTSSHGYLAFIQSIKTYGNAILEQKDAELKAQQLINNEYEDTYDTIDKIRQMEAFEYDKKTKEEEARKALSGYALQKRLNEIELEYQKAIIEFKVSIGEMTEQAGQAAINALVNWATKTVESINDEFAKAASQSGFTEEQYSKYLVTKDDQAKGLVKFEEDIKNKYKAQVEIIDRLNRYKKQGLAYNKEELASAEQRKTLLEIMARILGISLVEEGKSKKSLRDRLDLVTKMRKEYEQNLKLMDKKNAIEFTHNQFKDNDLYKLLVGKGVIEVGTSFDADNTIETLKRLMNVVDAETKKQIQETISQLSNEQITLDIKLNLEKAKEEVEALFDSLSLGEELEELGLGKEVTESLFGFESISLDELERKLKEIRDEYEKNNRGIGTDELKVFDGFQKKIKDKRNKDLKDRLKQYTQYLKKEYSQAVLIKLEEAKALADISEMEDKIGRDMAEKMRAGVKAETDKKFQKAQWEEFQNTDMYVEMFDDLDKVSTAVLEKMQENLLSLQDKLKLLDPSSLKEIQARYNEIQDTLYARDGWGDALASFKKYQKEVNSLQSKGVTEDYLETTLFDTEAEVERLKDIRDIYDECAGKIAQGTAAAGEKVEIAGVEYELNQDNLTLITQASNEVQGQIDAQQAIIKNLRVNLASYKNLRAAAESVVTKWESIISVVNSIRESVMKVVDAVGLIEEDSPEAVFVDMASQLLDMVGNAVIFYFQLKAATVQANALGAAMNAAMGIIGWIVIAIQAIATILSSIINAKQKQFERSIERQKEKVEELQKAYEELERIIDNVYSISKLRSYNAEMVKNLKTQLAAQKAMLAAYEDNKHKKKYKDEISETRDNIRELELSLEELSGTYIESLGGFGTASNIKSAAESFVDAWVSAFKETGDGISGLQEQMDEFINNAIKKQLLLRLSEQYITPMLEKFDKMFTESSAGGVEATEAELSAWKIAYEKYSEAFNDKAKHFMEAMGIDGSSSTDKMTGLAEGIQGVTEEEAEIVAAITESIRYFVADTNAVMHNFELHLMTPEEVGNPWYAQLQSQTNYLREIRDAFASVIYQDGLVKRLRVSM